MAAGSATVPGAVPAADIDVGAAASDGTLRVWLARQAVEKGEAVLAAQLAAVGRLGANASSILGWSVTIALALGAVISSALTPPLPVNGAPALGALVAHLLWPAVVALAAILAAAVCCVRVLWPGYWRPPGHAPDRLLAVSYPTELEVLEAVARGYAEGVALNASSLTRLEQWLRAAWILFAGAPIAGAIAYGAAQIGG